MKEAIKIIAALILVIVVWLLIGVLTYELIMLNSKHPVWSVILWIPTWNIPSLLVAIIIMSLMGREPDFDDDKD